MKKILIILIFIFHFNTTLSYSNYSLTSNDTRIIDSFVSKININIINKWDDYKTTISNKLLQIIQSDKYNSRIVSILEEVHTQINYIEEIQLKDENNPRIERIDNKVLNNNTYKLENIDISIIKNNWLFWNDEVRNNLWLEPYSYNSILETSALIWSKYSKDKWEISHKREIWDSFYNYTKINNWFSNNGIVCENISWITHTENIWWWGYSCTDWECSDELSQATKRAFDSYLAEKWTTNDAHYRSLTQPYFTQVWLWISLDKISDTYFEYYLTIHYCTQLQ